MCNDQIEQTVRELLTTTETNVCIEHLEEFWESWITGDFPDCSSSEYRAARLFTYKALRGFLTGLKQ